MNAAEVFCSLLVACLLIASSPAAACDTDWQFMGQTPWPAVSAVFYPTSADTILIGTGWNTAIPGSGGVYRHIGSDTSMEYAGLINNTVWRFRNFSFFQPDRVFASTSRGIYEFAGDTTWNLLHYSVIPLWDFDVSPLDTNLWLAASHNDVGAGDIIVSEDGGIHWQTFYTGWPFGSLLCSRYHAGQAFFADAGRTALISIPDSTYEIVQDFSPAGPKSIFYHSTEPWIYSVAYWSIGRYNEETGDAMIVAAPDSISVLRNGYYDQGSNALLVATSSGLYLVSDDLSSWQHAESNVPFENGRLLVVVDSGCVAFDVEDFSVDRVYVARSTPSLVAPWPTPPERPFVITVYPNPSTGTLVMHLPAAGKVEIFDLLGRRVAYVSSSQGFTKLDLVGGALSSGTFFYQYFPNPAGLAKAATGKIQLIR